MKPKFLSFLIFFAAAIGLCGSAFGAWVTTVENDANLSANVAIQDWVFGDLGFAKYDNILSVTNVTATKDTTVTQGSSEALRLTNTAGTLTKDHIVNISFDRDYYLSEIRYFKFEFDYYHRYKREQYNKGFPKVQFTINNSTLGSDQGGTDTCTDKSAFVATVIDENWWHLEYYVFAHMPTLTNHGDSPIALTKKINGVRINDRTVYDYAGTTAFVVIDNMVFSAQPASRLGIFNRWTGDVVGKWFWVKIAFAGTLHSCVLTSSDPTVALPEFAADDTTSTTAPFPNGSPFYVKLLKAGTFNITATLELGDNHDVYTITTDNFTVT